jgi:hypothetical protein
MCIQSKDKNPFSELIKVLQFVQNINFESNFTEISNSVIFIFHQLRSKILDSFQQTGREGDDGFE